MLNFKNKLQPARQNAPLKEQAATARQNAELAEQSQLVVVEQGATAGKNAPI